MTGKRCRCGSAAVPCGHSFIYAERIASVRRATLVQSAAGSRIIATTVARATRVIGKGRAVERQNRIGARRALDAFCRAPSLPLRFRARIERTAYRYAFWSEPCVSRNCRMAESFLMPAWICVSTVLLVTCGNPAISQVDLPCVHAV